MTVSRDVRPPAPGPIHELVPALHILSLTPRGGGRLYATAGLWDATREDGHGLELVLYAPAADDVVHVETVPTDPHRRSVVP